MVSRTTWHLPENGEALSMAIRWCLDDDLTVDVHAPLTVTAELVRQAATDRWMLHLVNYQL